MIRQMPTSSIIVKSCTASHSTRRCLYSDIYFENVQNQLRTPKLPMTSDAYFYSLLVLFLPPKLENDILLNTEDDTVHESAQDAFLQKRHLLVLDGMHLQVL